MQYSRVSVYQWAQQKQKQNCHVDIEQLVNAQVQKEGRQKHDGRLKEASVGSGWEFPPVTTPRAPK